MAKTKLYTLIDTEAQLTGPIMQHRREAPAIRDFHSVFTLKDSQPAKYPEQFNLICLGEQDDETGQITPYTPPEVVATGAEWLAMNRIQTLASAGTALNGDSVQRSPALSEQTTSIDRPAGGYYVPAPINENSR